MLDLVSSRMLLLLALSIAAAFPETAALMLNMLADIAYAFPETAALMLYMLRRIAAELA